MFENTHFPQAKKFWLNGKFYDWSYAHVHGMSHALHYGSSVFEGIRAYNTPKGPAVFQCEKHVERFFHSASILNMEISATREEVAENIKAVIRENQLEAAYIRPILFYSYGNLGLVPKACPVEFIISAWKWGAYLGDKAEKGVHVYILPTARIHHSQYDMGAKLGGIYVLSTIGGVEARKKGYDEALYLNLEGRIAEGPGENILIVKDGILKTNDQSESILEGITRTSILQIAQDLGIPTKVEPITKAELFAADEAFFSGTAVEITPVVRVTDGSNPSEENQDYTIGQGMPGPITQQLTSAFMDTVAGKRPEYDAWLTYVNE